MCVFPTLIIVPDFGVIGGISCIALLSSKVTDPCDSNLFACDLLEAIFVSINICDTLAIEVNVETETVGNVAWRKSFF